MNVDIQSLGFSITPALTGHAQRRLKFVLARHSNRIQHVVVRLGDVNGPRGGVDKFCRIQVQLLNAPAALIEEVGDYMYAVIDRAADRVGRVVVKHLERSRPGARDPGRRGNAPPFNVFDPGPELVHTERPST